MARAPLVLLRNDRAMRCIIDVETEGLFGEKREQRERVKAGQSASGTPPSLIARVSLRSRVAAVVVFGSLTIMGLISLAAGMAQGIHIGWIAFFCAGVACMLGMLMLAVLHKTEFFDDHVKVQSLIGRVQTACYEDLSQVLVSNVTLQMVFNDGRKFVIDSSEADIPVVANFLRVRGVRITDGG